MSFCPTRQCIIIRDIRFHVRPTTGKIDGGSLPGWIVMIIMKGWFLSRNFRHPRVLLLPGLVSVGPVACEQGEAVSQISF